MLQLLNKRSLINSISLSVLLPQSSGTTFSGVERGFDPYRSHLVRVDEFPDAQHGQRRIQNDPADHMYRADDESFQSFVSTRLAKRIRLKAINFSACFARVPPPRPPVPLVLLQNDFLVSRALPLSFGSKNNTRA